MQSSRTSAKLPPALCNVVPRFARYRRGRYNYEYEDDWTYVAVPPQPEIILPKPSCRIPQNFRKRIYELLLNWFPNGVDTITFVQSYSKRYGYSLSTAKECGMPIELAFRVMADIVDVGHGFGRMWIRPIPYEYVKQFCREEDLIEQARMDDLYGEFDFIDKEKAAAKAEEERDKRPEGEQIRSEVTELISHFDNGINVESLAVLYSFHFPARGIDRSRYDDLIQLLEKMPDIIKLFEGEEDGLKCVFAKYVGPKTE